MECPQYEGSQMDRSKYDEMFAFFRGRFKEKTRDEWYEELRQTDICVGPVLAMDEVFADPHVQHRQMVVEIDHPTQGKVKQVGIAPKFSDTPGSIRRTGPERGEHTDEVLRENGFTDDEIAKLREAGAAG
jgi:crotonobetainyl-CoA:carnitine CoA-transferase CaiB-like acyl-CoA transferase